MKIRKKKLFDFKNATDRLVYVEWDDSNSTYGWREGNQDDSRCGCKSIGILVADLKHHITISTTISDGIKFLDQLTIPKAAICKIDHFKFDVNWRKKRG